MNISGLGFDVKMLFVKILWSGSGLVFMLDFSELLVELLVVIVLLLFELIRLSMFEVNFLSSSFFFFGSRWLFIGKDYDEKFLVLIYSWVFFFGVEVWDLGY